jgi:hypothetical protein
VVEHLASTRLLVRSDRLDPAVSITITPFTTSGPACVMIRPALMAIRPRRAPRRKCGETAALEIRTGFRNIRLLMG